jgi:hypothetical protein
LYRESHVGSILEATKEKKMWQPEKRKKKGN